MGHVLPIIGALSKRQPQELWPRFTPSSEVVVSLQNRVITVIFIVDGTLSGQLVPHFTDSWNSSQIHYNSL